MNTTSGTPNHTTDERRRRGLIRAYAVLLEAAEQKQASDPGTATGADVWAQTSNDPTPPGAGDGKQETRPKQITR